MKKLIALILAIMMVFSLAVTAFAADGDGSITIDGVSVGITYTIYRMLDLESFEKDAAYSYKVNSAWETFFNEEDVKTYVDIDEAGYVTWKAAEDETTKANFAKKALEYALEKGIASVATYEIPADYAGTTYKFENLELGWYLVDSTAGALCGLTTTDKDAVIVAKNHVPTIDKQVQEDLTGNWQSNNNADIGQIVNFKSLIHVAAGAENYVMHDTMSAGLTFVHDTVNNRGVTKITHTNSQGVETVLVEGTHYTVLHKAADCEIENCEAHCEDSSCSFEVVFATDYVKTLKPNDRLQVEYNAMLNRHAVVAGDGNPNQVMLEYGEENYTVPATTKTYTFSFDIVKTTTSNTLLDGAEFRIYDAATGGNEIAVVPLLDADDKNPVLDSNDNPIYRRARADETGVSIVVKGGLVTVVGLDNGVYYLEETKSPSGYNKLTSRKEFTIADGNVSARFDEGIYATGSGVQVVNKTGTMLPETGAMGTTMFIVFGMFAVLAAGVLLVTKKRMSMIVD